jgi:chromosome segregation ATPase
MTSPDLSRRVASHTEDLRVLGDEILQISDNVTVIKSAQDKHGTQLDKHGMKLEALSSQVGELGSQVGELRSQVGELRSQVDKGFAAILRRLGGEPDSNS